MSHRSHQRNSSRLSSACLFPVCLFPVGLLSAILVGCSDGDGDPSIADVDERLRVAIARLEGGDATGAAEVVTEAFEHVGDGGAPPDEVATLTRLQELLLPHGPDVVSPLCLVNTTLALAAVADLQAARNALAAHVEERSELGAADYAPLLSLGHLAMKFGFDGPGQQWFEKARAAAPDRIEAALSLGASYAAQGRMDDALAEFDHVVAVDPDHAEGRLSRGRVLEKLLRIDDALADWRRAVELDDGPIGARASNHLGAVLTRRGDNDGALAAFMVAVDLAPESAVYVFNVGQLLHLVNRSEEAVPYLKRAVELRPQDARPHFLLGQIADDDGDDAAAERGYREALRLAPNDETARYRLSLLLRRTGRGEEADRLVAGDGP